MKKRILAACLPFLTATGLVAAPMGTAQESISVSKQFVIYSDDFSMRTQVSSFAEQTKAGMLDLFGLTDRWKIPIVITFLREDAAQPDRPVSEVRFLRVEGGYKIELNVSLGGDLAKARFQQQLVRALLLEMEYRNQPAVQNTAYIEPPHWLVEGITVYLRNRDAPVDVDVYKALLDSNHIPPIADFLTQDISGLNSASLKLYQAYSSSLLQLVAGLPNGHAGLAAYVHDLALGHDSPTVDLIKHFPALGGSEESLEKWWALSLARISASDRYKGLGLEETEKQLSALLKIVVPTGKNDETKMFAIEDYKQFVKLPQARSILANAVVGLEGLQTQANPLFRPIVAEYLAIAADLQRGKTRRVDERLKDVAKYRELILTRMDQIDDYMNWLEATQMTRRSDSFDDYMRTANQLSDDSPKRDDAISQYLDAVELQMQ